MYRLSLSERKHFRKMEHAELYNLRHRCNHKYFQKVQSQDLYLTDERPEIFVCNKCKIAWHVHHTIPMRGNRLLEEFFGVCNHTYVRTLGGSETKNHCLECDEIIEKTELAKLWKGIRTTASKTASKIKNIVEYQTRSLNQTENTKNIRYVWDPDIYGSRKWGIEYDD